MANIAATEIHQNIDISSYIGYIEHKYAVEPLRRGANIVTITTD